MAEQLANAGLNVPEILAADVEQGFLILSDLGLETWLQVLTTENADQLFSLAIQALKSIGQENVSQVEIEQIQNALMKEKVSHLEHDIRVAPAWIKEIIRYSLQKLKGNE